jgi:hypothetical protein
MKLDLERFARAANSNKHIFGALSLKCIQGIGQT